jgi:glycine/D-amino acid oxidase-like deaminating enzyme
MQFDFLIIGQGISGTWLSYYLQEEQQSFLVIDNNEARAPSRLAAGIINPITGRRHVTTWMADQLLPFVWDEYQQLGKALKIEAISRKDIIDFFPSPQMRLSFQQRTAEQAAYISISEEENGYRSYFQYDFGFGEIKPVYTAHLENILPAWRTQLENNGQIRTEHFDPSFLTVHTEHITYKDIRAGRIIFCDGSSGADNPFAPNKGEALIVEIPDLPANHIYKKGLSLVPLAEKNHWWIGSAYEWEFEHPDPTPAFKEKTMQVLDHWLKIPFHVKDHVAGIRPATLERRPFVGWHPLYPAVGILNGMGTKGCSLAPYFARELLMQIRDNSPISAEADISRFARILQRS